MSRTHVTGPLAVLFHAGRQCPQDARSRNVESVIDADDDITAPREIAAFISVSPGSSRLSD